MVVIVVEIGVTDVMESVVITEEVSVFTFETKETEDVTGEK